MKFVVPTDLPDGEYELSMVTQHSGGGKELKHSRTLKLEYELTVG